MKEYRLVRDNDCHDYLIEADKLREFNCWVDEQQYLSENYTENEINEMYDFNSCRVNPYRIIIEKYRIE